MSNRWRIGNSCCFETYLRSRLDRVTPVDRDSRSRHEIRCRCGKENSGPRKFIRPTPSLRWGTGPDRLVPLWHVYP